MQAIKGEVYCSLSRLAVDVIDIYGIEARLRFTIDPIIMSYEKLCESRCLGLKRIDKESRICAL